MNVNEQVVILDDGQMVKYDKCLIATGKNYTVMIIGTSFVDTYIQLCYGHRSYHLCILMKPINLYWRCCRSQKLFFLWFNMFIEIQGICTIIQWLYTDYIVHE